MQPNQSSPKSNWACPCNGCKKAAKQVIDKIIEEYKSCPNIIESENKLFCYTWWRHDDCERIRELLFRITNDFKYTRPEVRQEVAEAVDQMLEDPQTAELLKRLSDN